MRYLNAGQATAELERLTGEPWTVNQVLMEAESERLPVCFKYNGELAVFSIDGKTDLAGRVLDFRGIVRSMVGPDEDGLMSQLLMVELIEAYGIQCTHQDGERVRGVDLPTEFGYGGRIKPGHTVVCYAEGVDISPDKFLFDQEDLVEVARLKTARPDVAEIAAERRIERIDAATSIAPGAENPAKQPDIAKPAAVGRIERIDATQASSALGTEDPPKSSPTPAGAAGAAERDDLLRPVLREAMSECGRDAKPAQVFSLMRVWANAKKAPLMGATETGIQWLDASDCPREIDQAAIGKRMRRIKAQ